MFSDVEGPLDTLHAHTLVNIGLAFLCQLLQPAIRRVCRDHEVDELNPHLVRAGLAR